MLVRVVLVFLSIFFTSNFLIAQTVDSTLPKVKTIDSVVDAKKINLVKSDSLIGTQENEVYYNRLIGNVVLTHDGSTLSCDSARLYFAKNLVEAFGNVVITSPNGASCVAQYLKFNGNNNIALLRDNVSLEDGENTLNTEAMTYNVKTKYATYSNGGTLQNSNTVLTSNSGNYNGVTKDAYFKGDVVVTDPKYQVDSKELKYNTKTKMVKFVKETTIITDNSTISGNKGYYDADKEIGQFNTRASVLSDEQQITANFMHYDKKKGISNAKGNVIVEDYKNERNLFCEKADYNEITKRMNAYGEVVVDDVKDSRRIFCDKLFYDELSKYLYAEKDVIMIDSAQQSTLRAQKVYFNNSYNYLMAVGKPILSTLLDKDSVFIKADTFFSAPSKNIDTITQIYVPNKISIDSNQDWQTEEESKKISRTLIAFHNVKVFGDSMQAVCDSLKYSQVDSMYWLYRNPVLWYKQMQAKGDTVIIHTKNNKVSEVNLIDKAVIISEVDSVSKFYDQVSASRIDAYLVNEEIEHLEANLNAESIYFSKNDEKEYMGMNKSKAKTLIVNFKNKEVSKISFYEEPEGNVVPMKEVSESNKKLGLFEWLEVRRPKSKLELLK